MFKVDVIRFNHADEFQEYKFSEHCFIYGKNTRGKTALTMVIDYILGSSDKLTYQGLDNIDSIEALLKNEMTSLWIKRTVKEGGYFYRRTEESDYSEVSADTYKDNICLILTQLRNNRYLEIYNKVFDEHPSFRSFNFLNYIEEKGLGDLSTVFTKAKELKHNIRIRNIMNFFFNFENIEQIYEKELLLDAKSKELEKLSSSYQEYSRSKVQQQKIFKELQLDYTGKYSNDYKTFCDFRSSYVRKAKANSKDLVYLSQSSFSLAEEIKIYNFMKNQSSNMVDRKERIKRLLSIMSEIVGDEPDYEEYTRFIKETIETLDEENVILSLTDYNKAIKDIEKEKKKLDYQIELLKASSEKLSYEDAMKKVGLLEHIFVVLQEEVDIIKYHDLSQEVENLKKEIKELKSSFNQKKINDFNKRLTEIYLESGLEIQHLQDDIQEEGFALEFDPFRLCLSAKHKKGDNIVNFMPGSMARQTHIQMLVYLTMFEYLNKNFSGFIYMPLLVIDSANQPMGVDSFEKVYPVLIEMAEEVGIQTIFMSKDMISGIKDDDLIDISDGLNKFHKA